jgi:O-antigen ligase
MLRNLLIGVLLIGSAWLVLPEEHKNRVRTIWDPQAGPQSAEASKQGRILAFQAAMEIHRRFPITGVGPANFGAYRAMNVDGSNLSPHNILGQGLGETGLLGVAAFLWMVGATIRNCRRTRLLADRSEETNLRVLAALAVACRNSVLLLLFEGIAGHNLGRYNWLWLAAFAMLAAEFAARIANRVESADGALMVQGDEYGEVELIEVS